MNQPAPQQIPTDVIRRLSTHLSTQFNVQVRVIGTGLDANDKRVIEVAIDHKNAAVIGTLPPTFEGENVVYRTSKPRLT